MNAIMRCSAVEAALEDYRAATEPLPAQSLNRVTDERIMRWHRDTDREVWVMLLLRGRRDYLYLHDLFTPHDWRGLGYASHALEWLCGLSARHNVTIQSRVQPFGCKPGLNKSKLRAWYRRHGWIVRRDDTMILRT